MNACYWLCAASLLICACEIPRPANTYDSGPLGGEPAPLIDTTGLQGQEMITGNSPFTDDVLPPNVIALEDGGIPTADGGTAGDPLLQKQGDYLFRIETEISSQHDTLGTVTTRTTSLGQMRVLIIDGVLQGSERLCSIETFQIATSGTIQTTIDPMVAVRLTPIIRTFSINGTSWSTDVVMRRQGWRADLDTMPKNPAQADLFLDPDLDNYPGVRTEIRGSATVAGFQNTLTCAYDIVSFAATAFEGGTFAPDGTFATATIRVDSDDAHALRASRVSGTGSCDESDINDAPSPTPLTDTIRMMRVQGGWLPGDGAECAPASDFASL